ncbi:putative NACHT, partial [Triplophysa rosa]
SPVPCGLINQGMTCYLNTVLQTLFMTVKYRNKVLSPEKDSDQSPEKNILKALANLFRKLEDEKSAVDTKEVTDALNIPDVFEQQDAAEYLQMILHKTPEPSTVFRGTMQTTTKCYSCTEKYEAETDFLSIPMSVDNKGQNAVHEALYAYEDVHEMNDEDQLYCVNCDSMKNMQIANYIKEWPDILTLQIKRFEMTLTQMGVDYCKNEYQVNFPSEIEVYDLNYELHVIINHHGTYKSGHYDVFIKDESKKWFYFNDHIVQKVDCTTTELIRHSCRSAYLLMYRSVPEESTKEDERPKEQNCRPQTETNKGRRSDDTPQRTPQQALASAEKWDAREISQKRKKTKKPEDEGTSSKDKKTKDMSQPPCPKSSMQEYSQDNIGDASEENTSVVSACHLKTFKQRMKQQLMYLEEGTFNGERQLLTDIFIEHNMREKTFLCTADDKEIMCSKIFEGENIKTVLTKGDAGFGKTVSVQKFVLDWAEERTHTDIKYIFLITCQKLNIISENVMKCSFIELLQQCFDITEDLKLCDSDKIMFILDGLNELKLPLDFERTKKITDVNQSASVAVLLTNLIRRNLLPKSLIWITSRPGAAAQRHETYVDRVTQLNGFNDKQKEKCFRKSITDQRMANRVISHIKTSRRIHSICHIPDYCRILATMSEAMLWTDHEEIPKTLTQMYATLLVAQTKMPSHFLTKENILSLACLAFQLLVNGKSSICAEDLKRMETIMTSSANIKTGIICQNKNKSFCFVNHRTQEFLAALYVTEMITRGRSHVHTGHVQEFSILKLDPSYGDMCFTEYHLLQNVVDRALERQMDDFLCFLLGLSLESSQRILQGFLTQRESGFCIKQAITENIKKMIQNSPPEKSSRLFNCLMEVDERFLVQEIKAQLTYGVRLSPSEWSAHMFVLVNSEEQLDEIELSKSGQLEKHSLKLRPVLKTSGEPEVYQCGIGAKGCADLRSAMRLHVHLTELDLSGNYLGDSGVKQIIALLKDPRCKLEKLWLRSCNITEEGFTDLSSALKSCSHLTELDLSGNFLDDSGVKLVSSLMSHCKLKRLFLRSCNIHEMGCADLTSALTSNPSHLRELDLSNNLLGDLGVKQLSALLDDPHCKLQKLWLKCCRIGERGSAFLLAALQSNPSHLTELDLSENVLCSSGLKDVSFFLNNSSCRLVKIMLRSCKIPAMGCAALSSALRSNPSHLTELDLSDNVLSDSGVKQISALLKHPQCKLQKLWLRSCLIHDRSCADLSSALRSNPSHLTELDLSNNWLSDSGVKHISVVLCKLKKLWLRSCNITEEGCADLSSALRSNPSHLTELDLSDNWFSDSGVKQLAHILQDHRCELQKLWLRSCRIKEEGCADLSSALRSNPSHLRELDLSNNEIRDSGVKHISALIKHPRCKLEKLWLRSCYITEKGCTELRSALKSKRSYLTELDLIDNDIGDSGVKKFSDLLEDPQCKLETLWLRSCLIHDRSCADLSSALRSNPSHLTELDLSYNHLYDSMVEKLTLLLKHPQCKLQKLWLRSCHINEEGCAALSSALRSNPSHLTELDLSDNWLGDSGVKQISALIKHPQCKLQKLWLRSCNIHEMRCADLSSALRSNPSHLTELDLSDNWLSDSGVEHISALIKHPQCKLQKLWLRSCHIKEEGCADLSSALRSNPSHLTELDLSENNIRDSGAEQLSLLLKDPLCKLEILWLNSCSITHECTHLLKSHKTKVYLNVVNLGDTAELETCFSQMNLL